MAGVWGARSEEHCRYFASGHCREGVLCRFSHTLQMPLYDMPNSPLIQSSRASGALIAEITAYNMALPSENAMLADDWGAEADSSACQACTLRVPNPTAAAATAATIPTVSAMAGATVGPTASVTNGAAAMVASDRQDRVVACPSRNNERRLEAEAGRLRSVDKSCGVCLEVVLEKQPGEQRFGILPNCQHCFCLSCLRQWRQARQFHANIIRACPQCRVPSDFVCPSVFWVETQEQKDKLITDYKTALGMKDCKYFRSGRGKCPFGNKCFYRHAFPDGTKADVGPPHPRSRGRPRPRPRHRRDVDILEVSLTISHWHILALLPPPLPPPPPPTSATQAF